MEIYFTVDGDAVGKGRPRFARRGKFVTTYSPKKTVDYENSIKLVAAKAMYGMGLMNRPVIVNLTAVFDVPVSWSKKKRVEALAGTLYPTSKFDIDNIAKSALDACNGVVWVDDKQVVECHLYKRYGENPFLSMNIKEIL